MYVFFLIEWGKGGKGVLIGSDGLFPLFGRLGEGVSACKRTHVCQIMNES